MPKLKHDSQSEKYRWPLGARPCGSSVRLRISAPEGANCTLRLWTEKGEEKIPMRLRGYMDGKEVADFIQKKCRLACDVGEWFSFEGHGFVRINLATDTKYIKEAVERILHNLKELNKEG